MDAGSCASCAFLSERTSVVKKRGQTGEDPPAEFCSYQSEAGDCPVGRDDSNVAFAPLNHMQLAMSREGNDKRG